MPLPKAETQQINAVFTKIAMPTQAQNTRSNSIRENVAQGKSATILKMSSDNFRYVQSFGVVVPLLKTGTSFRKAQNLRERISGL